MSDSVVQATLHVVKVFWSLQGRLAQQRHFPAIDWLTSYSFYNQYLKESFELDPYQADVAGELGRLGVVVRIPRKTNKNTQGLNKNIKALDKQQ